MEGEKGRKDGKREGQGRGGMEGEERIGGGTGKCPPPTCGGVCESDSMAIMHVCYPHQMHSAASRKPPDRLYGAGFCATKHCGHYTHSLCNAYAGLRGHLVSYTRGPWLA